MAEKKRKAEAQAHVRALAQLWTSKKPREASETKAGKG